jgi:hypothetical protein
LQTNPRATISCKRTGPAMWANIRTGKKCKVPKSTSSHSDFASETFFHIQILTAHRTSGFALGGAYRRNTLLRHGDEKEKLGPQRYRVSIYDLGVHHGNFKQAQMSCKRGGLQSWTDISGHLSLLEIHADSLLTHEVQCSLSVCCD